MAKTFYVTKQQLEDEIILSKKIFKESNYPRTPAECFTPNLTKYLVLLVDRYANKSQWRGYCVCSETEALTQRGWLNLDEINEDDIILSYTDGHLAWSKIKSIFRSEYNGKMFNLTVQGLDALVTPGHKFVTRDGLKPVEELREKDKLILTGDPVDSPTETIYDDAFVEIIGWTITEGNYYQDRNRKYVRVTLYQNEGEKANSIRTALNTLGEKFSECGKLNYCNNTNIAFHLTKNLCERILEVAPRKVPTMAFILSLSNSQRNKMIKTMVDADGTTSYGKYMSYTQCDKAQVDAFVTICTMAGYRTSTKLHNPTGYGKKPVYTVRIFTNKNGGLVESINFHGGKNADRIIGAFKSSYPNKPTVDYNGKVWCPETEYGSFMARRNGYVYLTGNSWILDMKSDALTTLCQNCFKYDETRFNNPFGYLTQIVKYCFITYLEKEELMRDIKDSLWESIGMTPSYTRQIKNEMLRDVVDQSNKGMKELKKDTDAINIKIELLSEIIFKMKDVHIPNIDIDSKISEVLEIEPLAFTETLDAVITLFINPPHYKIETGIKVADQTVNCITLFDKTTNSNTKHIIPNTEDYTIILALCFLALTIRRDILVKKVREISGYNITSTHIPTADKMNFSDGDLEIDTTYTEYTPPKRRPKKES